MLAYKEGESVRLISRNGRNHTKRFTDIARAVARPPARTLILDGEVCAFDAQLMSHIFLLDAAPEELATPPVFMAFDCVYQNGRDLRDRPKTAAYVAALPTEPAVMSLAHRARG